MGKFFRSGEGELLGVEQVMAMRRSLRAAERTPDQTVPGKSGSSRCERMRARMESLRSFIPKVEKRGFMTG
jgi:hypothetical protein